MRIISWNVNGLRALYKKGQWGWFFENNPDIFCIQETKSSPDQLPDEVRNPPGFFPFFDSSQDKKGYSGVASYFKVKPKEVWSGLKNEDFSKEGRVISADLGSVMLCNVYFPNGGGGPERLKYKLDFYEEFLDFIESYRKKGKEIIFCGDVNTAHKPIDLARPKENENNTGFLPEERAWIDRVVGAGYVDIFRHLNPDKAEAYTYWDMKTFARDRNVGWRIDYFFVSENLVESVKSAKIHENVLGSDHCPIELTLGS
jgi:exodeoxyribonuclease-3